MKIIMFMGIPSSNNLELAKFIQLNKYPDALIFNRDYIKMKPQYKDLPSNSLIIDFAFIQSIKTVIQKESPKCIIVIAPFILKDSREYFFEAFKGNEFIGVWVERSRQKLLENNKLSIPSFQETEDIIDYYLKYKVSPTVGEPFKEIVYITREINTGISKNYPYIADLETVLLRL